MLGVLHYFGRGFNFNDIEEANKISAETHSQIFHIWIEYGSTIIYKLHVTLPLLDYFSSESTTLFELAGLNGCLGSTDATYIGMRKCSCWAFVLHKGHKLSMPSRTYNMTVTHAYQILGSTFGHPATWNDKTMIKYDALISGINNGSLLSKN